MDVLVEVLSERLGSLHSDLKLLPNTKKLSSKVTALEQAISEILPSLRIAERQMERNSDVELLVKEVTNPANRLESLLDESEALSDRLRAQSFSPKLMGCFNIRNFFTSLRLLENLKKVTAEFRRMKLYASPFSSPPADDKQTYGRKDDLQNIKKSLLSDSDDDRRIPILCIVGLPGIGKTTVARLAYDDSDIQTHFSVRTWVFVNVTNFDVRRVTQDLLKNLGIEIQSDIMDLDSLQQELKEYLSNKRVLMVLDHVGEIEPQTWNTFTVPLASAGRGSRVVMTMNKEAASTAASHVNKLEIYELERLSDDDCWSLLATVAFPHKNPDEYAHLVSVGKKLCVLLNGQLQEIKALGTVHKDNLDVTSWEKTLEDGPWKSDDGKPFEVSYIMSYYALPPNIKLCLTFCSIFPSNYKILKEMLILYWIAADLVKAGHGGTSTLETIAEKYFGTLCSQSFFDDSNEDGGILIHPPVTKVARRMSPKKDYHLIHSHDTSAPSDNYDISFGQESSDETPKEDIRSISCIYDVSMSFERLSAYTNVRTLIFLCSPMSGPTMTFLDDQLLPDSLFNTLTQLCILSLSGLPMKKLSDSIQNLKQLRLLDLSHTLIEKLPDSTSTLDNLLTLKLNNCVSLTKLPTMDNLIKLRHLNISASINIKAMPRGIGRLTNLQSLSNFIVGGTNESCMKELGDLVSLSGKLRVSGLQNVADSTDAKDANLANKTFLRDLVLEWSSKFSALRNEDVETEVLKNLKPSTNLEILSIISYGGTGFPEWISLSHKLVRLTIKSCRKCGSLPLLGQLPLLTALSFEGMHQVIRIGPEFCGDGSEGQWFPSLQMLEFKDMPLWEEWSFDSDVSGKLPCLQLLKIERCPKLKKFKVLMEVLERLTISECQELTTFSPRNFPALRELDIQDCWSLKEMPQSFPSLTKLRIWGCKKLTSLYKNQPTGVGVTVAAMGEEFPRLLELDIQNCTSLKELPRKFPLLEKIRVRNCKELSKLSAFPKLDDLILEGCDELMLGEEVEANSLVSMVISELPKFEYPCAKVFRCSSRLINLEISKCVNLKALSEEENESEIESQALSSTLERLAIDGCPKFQQLPNLFSSFSSLKELIVVGCEHLEFSPEMKLPSVLKRLVFQKCKYLKTLPPNIFANSQDIGLEFLELCGCPSLVSIIEGELPPTLRLLSIWDCTGLMSLPAQLNRQNTSLISLKIRGCHSLENFPNEGLPRNIRTLSVMNCGKIKPLSEWGLNELKCLTNFSFGGPPEVVNLDEVELPNSVDFLLLKGFLKLVSLSRTLQNLNSLDILTIRDCPRLAVLAEERLPRSLSCLYISNCPVLRQRCKSREGEDWYKIKHIPLIEVDFQKQCSQSRTEHQTESLTDYSSNPFDMFYGLFNQ